MDIKDAVNHLDLISSRLRPSHSEEPPVKAKPPSPPASSSIATVLSGDVNPNAASSPREEPNGLEDSVNGAPAKRPHSPTQEDLAKRHKDTEVRRVFSAQGRSCSMYVLNTFGVGFLTFMQSRSCDTVLFLLQVVSNDDSAFKEPYPPSSDSHTQGEGPNIVGVIYSVCLHELCKARRKKTLTSSHIVSFSRPPFPDQRLSPFQPLIPQEHR